MPESAAEDTRNAATPGGSIVAELVALLSHKDNKASGSFGPAGLLGLLTHNLVVIPT